MKTSPLMLLGFNDIQHILDGRENNDSRCLHPEVGFVRSFAGIKEVMGEKILLSQPYRLVEGRIIVVRKGWAQVNLNLREQVLKAPMVVVYSPGTVGEVKKFSPDVDFSMLAFRNPFMENVRQDGLLKDYHQRRLGLCIPLQQKEAERMEQLLDLFWKMMHDTPFPTAMIKEMIVLLFRQIDCYRRHYMETEQAGLSRQEDILNRFIDLVNTYALRERKIAFYADKLCLTPHYLSNVVQQTSQQTIMDWINRAVIQETRILLLHSDLQISQIADRLHFPNASFFCKYFRRLTGMSPGAYKKRKAAGAPFA